VSGQRNTLSLTDLFTQEMPPSPVSKRRGYHALVPITRGMLLLREKPLIRLRADVGDLEGAIAAMAPADRKRFYQLDIAPDFKSYGPNLGTFRTNGFRAGCESQGSKERAYSGVFRLGSRFNHSCQPNVHQHWNGSYMEFRAVRYIATNEELCISYDIPRLLQAKPHRDLASKKMGD